MKKLLLCLNFVLTGCACVSVETGFGLDGKAKSWCEAKKAAFDFCDHKVNAGLQSKINYQPGSYIICDQDYHKIYIEPSEYNKGGK